MNSDILKVIPRQARLGLGARPLSFEEIKAIKKINNNDYSHLRSSNNDAPK